MGTATIIERVLTFPATPILLMRSGSARPKTMRPTMINYNVDTDGIATITWDMPGRSMNVLNEASMTAYAGALEEAHQGRQGQGHHPHLGQGRLHRRRRPRDAAEHRHVGCRQADGAVQPAAEDVPPPGDRRQADRGGDQRHRAGRRLRDLPRLPLPHRRGQPQGQGRPARGQDRPAAGRRRHAAHPAPDRRDERRAHPARGQGPHGRCRQGPGPDPRGRAGGRAAGQGQGVADGAGRRAGRAGVRRQGRQGDRRPRRAAVGPQGLQDPGLPGRPGVEPAGRADLHRRQRHDRRQDQRRLSRAQGDHELRLRGPAAAVRFGVACRDPLLRLAAAQPCGQEHDPHAVLRPAGSQQARAPAQGRAEAGVQEDRHPRRRPDGLGHRHRLGAGRARHRADRPRPGRRRQGQGPHRGRARQARQARPARPGQARRPAGQGDGDAGLRRAEGRPARGRGGVREPRGQGRGDQEGRGG